MVEKLKAEMPEKQGLFTTYSFLAFHRDSSLLEIKLLLLH